MALDTLARAMAAHANSKAKTAYQYAVEGGYTGTEEQFTEDMGNLGINADAVNNAVRFDIAQAKTELQKLQAQANIGLDTSDGDINAQLALRALITGYYEAMGVGTADNLTSSQRVTDEEAYNYRTTGGNVDVGSQENFKSLVGGTLALNQLVREMTSTYWESALGTASFADGVGTLTATQKYGVLRLKSGNHISLVAGHKYFISITAKTTTETNLVYAQLRNSTDTANLLSFTLSSSTTKRVFTAIYSPSTSESAYIRVMDTRESGWDAIEVSEVMLIDLTAKFGTIPQTVGGNSYNSIADYVYGLSGTNGIAWLYKYFPILNGGYIPYSAPTLGSVCCDKHITTELNLWDEVKEGGYYDMTTGQPASDSARQRSKNYIRILPNTEYRISQITYHLFYDIDHNFISGDSAGNLVFTTPSNAYYMKFWANNARMNEDICLIIHYDGEMDGVYEPYEAHTYDMGHETLRGIYMLDSFGNLYCNPTKNDTKTSDGEITRRRNYKKLSDLTWVKNGSAEHQFYASLTGADRSVVDSACICNKYINNIGAYNNTGDKFIWFKTGTAWIIDSAYSDAASLQASLTDVYADYLAETPTTESGTEFTELQKCHNWGTEELTDYEVGQGNRVVSIPVGHVTEYPVDLKAKLEMTPTPPLEDGSYIVQVSNGEAQYVPLGSDFPVMPTTDGTYSLKATVSSGTATMSWVADT